MFRKKHWNLTKKYIIQNTNHPVATGGTPITTWLPNQLGATLEYIQDVLHQKCFDEIPKEHIEFFDSLSLEIQDHIQTVMDEVYSLQPNFNRQEHQSFLRR
jgi:indoleamine 2,3-dioxygenase